jgi:hypothetical protein
VTRLGQRGRKPVPDGRRLMRNQDRLDRYVGVRRYNRLELPRRVYGDLP